VLDADWVVEMAAVLAVVWVPLLAVEWVVESAVESVAESAAVWGPELVSLSHSM